MARLGGCPTGEARLTPGFRLPARFVIHAVGPVWQGGGQGEDALLAAAYRSSLALALQHGLVSLAFPAISTGVYGYPLARACDVAVGAVEDWTAANPGLQRVVFCVFGAEAEAAYRDRLSR
jgi:O-acetyl-ADP-ribose deacetylase (regulator of RNase III)